MEHANSYDSGGFFRLRNTVVLFGFLAVAGYFLWTEHRAHVVAAVPYLPYLLLALCPLLHLFMHGRHGHDHGARSGSEEKE